MTEDKYGASVATQKEQIEGTWELDGEEYSLLTEDTTKGTLGLIEEYMALTHKAETGEIDETELEERAEQLDNFPWEEDGDDDKDFIELVIEGKLIKPEIDVDDVPVRKLEPIVIGMMQTWGEGKQVADARDQMPLDEGNR